jgi:hypothetical protein
MLTITFAALMAAVLSNFWLLTNVSFAVPLSPTTQLPAIKISFPHKGQQIRVGSNILVSGISSPPPGVLHTGCTVSVLLNDVKPYQKTVALGHGMKGDYSVWHYAWGRAQDNWLCQWCCFCLLANLWDNTIFYINIIV